MNTKNRMFGLLLSSIISMLFSCGEDQEAENLDMQEYFTASVTGAEPLDFNASDFFEISRRDNHLNIAGSDTAFNRIVLAIFEYSGPGEYTYESINQEYEASGTLITEKAIYSGLTATLEITEISDGLSGTFIFNADDGNGSQVSVNEGEFYVKF